MDLFEKICLYIIAPVSAIVIITSFAMLFSTNSGNIDIFNRISKVDKQNIDDNVTHNNYLTMTCKKDNSSTGISETYTIEIKYDGNEIKSSKETYVLKDPQYVTLAKAVYEGKNSIYGKVNGIKFSNSISDGNFIRVEERDYTKMDLNELKNAIKKYNKEQLNTDIDESTLEYIDTDSILLDKYKELELGGYNCQ